MKIIFYILIVIIAACLINFWYEFYVLGHYYNSAGLFFTVLGALIPVAVIGISYKLISYLKSTKG
jgi:hypothetical protein